ncbi:MAG: FtsX-like permease family protein [Oscillospiraceae bacterium]|jgi:putative ABC transport system permease protein|nr:FtsX-like permease family protein [Oscillospiraceae bacterium]
MNAFAIATRNVRKSIRDYGIYFLTIIIGVALFYIFNSIGSQKEMMELNSTASRYLIDIGELMSGLSVIVSAILAFLILYANAFLVRRRKKELGIYMCLGMRKGKISRILFFETALVGCLSLIVGITLGVLVSQALTYVTASMLGATITKFSFVFSMSAAVSCMVYFGITFIIVLLFNTVIVNRQKLLGLLYADRKVPKFRKPNIMLSVLLFVCSVVILGIAYNLMLTNGLMGFFDSAQSRSQVVSIIMGCVGTFLFFFSLSGFFLKVVSSIKKHYHKGLNMFTLRQIDSKIHTTTFSMTFICLMLFLAISAISVGSSLSAAFAEYGSATANESAAAGSAATTYMSLYLGVVFLISCASVLAVTQLSEASDNQARYLLLSKLGASEKLIAQSIFRQVLIYFVAPLVLAISHSIVAIKVMSVLAAALADLNILSMSLVTGLILIVVYGGYFGLTYRGARKMAAARMNG